MKSFNVGVIGLGNRGAWWVTDMLAALDCVNIVGLCDVYRDRIDETARKLKKKGLPAPQVQTDDWKALIDTPEVDTVLVFSAWSNHVPAAVYSMSKGKPVAVEVGGAYGIEDCWELVKTYEKSNTPFMLLENCCYGEYELMALNMARHGLFGDIVHCDGGYLHDLRDEISNGIENRHYRFNEYLTRNAENYPTHEIGPISKIMNINNGNRFVSLVSVSSRSAGVHT
jgi:predicted dehydrogenase